MAFSVGGNAVILADREGFERDLPVPALDGCAEAGESLFEGARLRAERALARPVTHAVVVLAAAGRCRRCVERLRRGGRSGRADGVAMSP